MAKLYFFLYNCIALFFCVLVYDKYKYINQLLFSYPDEINL